MTDSLPTTPSAQLERLKRLGEMIQSNPEPSAELMELQGLRQHCADTILALPGKQKAGAEAEAAGKVVEFFVRSGFLDQPAAGTLLAQANAACAVAWNGVLAALLMAPAWQLRAAPRIEDTPMWMWPVYTECLLRVPPALTQQSQADLIAANYGRRLREIARLAETNLGSSAVKAVIERFKQAGDCTLLCNSSDSIKEILSLRGRIQTLIAGIGNSNDVFILPREGRRLKVGFVIESLENLPQARAALPWFEYLDDRRFETILFTFNSSLSALSNYSAKRVGESRILDEDRNEAVQALRGGLLDVLVFFTRVTRANDPVTALALHRLAPVQVVIDETRLTSGLPNADLAVVEDGPTVSRVVVHYTERLAVMPDTGVSFVSNSTRSPPTVEWAREGLGIPDTAVVYASVSPFANLTPEWLAGVAKVLASVPESRLLIYSYYPDDASESALGRVCALVDSVMTAHGVDQTRLILSNESLPSESEVLALLKVADLYLDTWPVSQGEGSLLALEAGLPVLTSRAGFGHPATAAWGMNRLGLGQCVSDDLAGFIASATRLGANAEERGALKGALKEALTNPESCGDPIAFADAFGTLLEKAFDEVSATGRPGFTSGSAAIANGCEADLARLCASVEEQLRTGFAPEAAAMLAPAVAARPTDPVIRGLHRRILMAEFRYDRAVDSLLSAVERQSSNADLWYNLGLALRGAGKRQDALQALEMALRLNHSNVEGWITLAEIAREAGHAELLREIATVVLQLEPSDPRAKDLAAMAGVQGA